jgi:hypothetical protein
MAVQLRVYRGYEDALAESDADADTRIDQLPEPTVHIRLGDLLPLVAMAQRMNFIWLKDFLDDEVCISEDLQDVLQNVRGIRPTAS